jgi:hypothetical protein
LIDDIGLDPSYTAIWLEDDACSKAPQATLRKDLSNKALALSQARPIIKLAK